MYLYFFQLQAFGSGVALASLWGKQTEHQLYKCCTSSPKPYKSNTFPETYHKVFVAGLRCSRRTWLAAGAGGAAWRQSRAGHER